MNAQFDSIDKDDQVFFTEQAYAFERMENNKIITKLAIFDPLPLLPLEKRSTVGDFLKNVDALCALGQKQDYLKPTDKSPFLANYIAGTRYSYTKVYEDGKAKPDYMVMSTVVDLSDPTARVEHSVSDFQIETNQLLDIEPAEFSTYGVVYSLHGDEETENVLAAREFEIGARRNPLFNKMYSKVQANDDTPDSLGRFVVWGGALAVKKAASLFSMDKSLHLLCRKHDNAHKERDSVRFTYNTVKKHFAETGKIVCSNMSVPLSSPIDLVNYLQLLSFKEKGHCYFGPKELDRLLPELQSREAKDYSSHYYKGIQKDLRLHT